LAEKRFGIAHFAKSRPLECFITQNIKKFIELAELGHLEMRQVVRILS
jgi:hypothetical protein